MNEFFSGKTQELGKGLFFENAFEIKPTNSIATSTRAMKMKFYGYWENLCSGELGRELSVNRVSRPGRFPGIAGNARYYGNDGKFHESHKILKQI